MRLSLRSNLDECFDKLASQLSAVHDIAIPRALNELQDQASTAGLRKIAADYGVGPRTMEKYTVLDRAVAANLEATIRVKGQGFPLFAFQPRQTAAGVSVRIKARRITIPGTFLATMKSGHQGVFARGAYGGKSGRPLSRTGSFGRFQFARGQRVKRSNKWGVTELPINELFTFGPAEAFSNTEVTQAMQDRVEQQAAKVIARNIAFARRG